MLSSKYLAAAPRFLEVVVGTSLGVAALAALVFALVGKGVLPPLEGSEAGLAGFRVAAFVVSLPAGVVAVRLVRGRPLSSQSPLLPRWALLLGSIVFSLLAAGSVPVSFIEGPAALLGGGEAGLLGIVCWQVWRRQSSDGKTGRQEA